MTMTTTRSDSDERLPLTSKKASISRDGFSQDSLKVVSLPPPLENDSVREMMMSSKKLLKSSPLAFVSEKDEETIGSDSVEASFSKEPEAIDVDCHGVVSSVPETTSSFLEEEKIKETSTQVGDDVHKKEADGSVVCISEKKGQEDSDVQRLLETKKEDVETLAVASGVHVNQHQKMERVRVKGNAFVGRSVNIDLVDDTALLSVVLFSKKAKDHPKDAPRKHKKNGGKQIVDGKKQDNKGNASNVVEGAAATKLSETCGNQLRIRYSINQMKSMRYAHSANQKKLWSDVYARLLPELVAEYESLVCWKIQKTSKSNMRESGIGLVSAVPRRNRVNIFVH